MTFERTIQFFICYERTRAKNGIQMPLIFGWCGRAKISFRLKKLLCVQMWKKEEKRKRKNDSREIWASFRHHCLDAGTENHHNANDINGFKWLMNKSDSHLFYAMSFVIRCDFMGHSSGRTKCIPNIYFINFVQFFFCSFISDDKHGRDNDSFINLKAIAVSGLTRGKWHSMNVQHFAHQ